MALKERLRRQLESARQLTDGYLQSLTRPEEWTHQVHPRANHPLWIMGHLAQTDNFLVSLVAPEKALPLPQYQECFGMGSQPTDDLAAYPPVAEVQQTFRERRAAMLELLESITEEDLAAPLPAGTPDFLSDKGSAFEMAVWHEGMHSGQLSVARRSLGYDPLM
ncbi:MAG: DinB family protein [Pirellulales bacterium]